MRVFVYWNLHKGAWSVKALEGPHKGRVIGRAHDVDLDGVTFRVSEAGRQRVLREQRKNVHAGAVGTLTGARWLNVAEGARWDALAVPNVACAVQGEQVSYNPYKRGSFYAKTDDRNIGAARTAYLRERCVVARNVVEGMA